MPSKVAVVIPIYKKKLNDLEKISLTQCRKVLKNYPIVFVAPEKKKFPYVAKGEMITRFPPQFFQSIKTYSQLLMSPFFYEAFKDFDYILIYQLDAFVFYDALEKFCSLGYDYIGAPWPYYSWQGLNCKKTPRVGNGGFCLRKVKACHKLLTETSRLPNWQDSILEIFDEDAFFALCGMTKGLNIAPVGLANLFSMEWYPVRHVKKLENELPFGCHGWNRFSADFYVELFAQFGYDLRPFRAQMGNNDYDVNLPSKLTLLAMNRLIRDLERKKPLLQYLPAKKFASVRVVHSDEAIKILAQMVVEDNSLADKIFLYDKKFLRDLIRDVTREESPHLVLCTDYDKPLIAAIEQKGLTYGEHVISFLQEYLKSQKKLFHNLGR